MFPIILYGVEIIPSLSINLDYVIKVKVMLGIH
jgi:hypothetical protein